MHTEAKLENAQHNQPVPVSSVYKTTFTAPWKCKDKIESVRSAMFQVPQRLTDLTPDEVTIIYSPNDIKFALTFETIYFFFQKCEIRRRFTSLEATPYSFYCPTFREKISQAANFTERLNFSMIKF